MTEQWQEKLNSGERWTEDDARAAVNALRCSGESASAFARRHGMAVQRLVWWRARLVRSAGHKLVPVVVSGTSTERPTECGAAVVLHLGAVCMTIEDASRVSAGWVAEVLNGLRGRA
jgi:hypothetical protein